jgi:PKD repeat protein
MLAAGHPIIVGVNLNANGIPSHFVLVTGKRNGQYVIIDPGHAGATTLGYYHENFETRGYVATPPADASELDISVGNAADLLVVDPLGRRTGYDPASGQILEEIPQSTHFVDLLENSDLTGAAGQDMAHLVNIPQPLAGTYQLFLAGSNAGAFQLSFRPFSANGSAGTSAVLSGNSAATSLAEFQVKLSGSGIVSQPFTNQCPWSMTPTNGDLPLDVDFSAPGIDSAGVTLTNWIWNFGDGGTGGGQFPAYIYNDGGVHFGSLSAIDTAGNTVISYGPAVVIPTVAVTVNPTSGKMPLSVQFSSAGTDSMGEQVSQWTWNFGDGYTGAGQNATHVYNEEGMFIPTLTAINSAGLTVVGEPPAVFPGTVGGMVTNGDFESGDFTDWIVTGDFFDAFVDTEVYGSPEVTPESGTYALFWGTVGSVGYLSQSIPTTAGENYLLSFWLNGTDGETPNEFSVSWEGATLFDQVNVPGNGWTNIQLVAHAHLNGSLLMFSFQDDPSVLGLDNVSVIPLQPSLNGISLSGHDLILSGFGAAGTTNCLLMGTNLAEPVGHWTPVATNILVNTGSFSFTAPNVVTPGVSGRYYILRQQ